MVSSCLKNIEKYMFFICTFVSLKKGKQKFALDLLNGACTIIGLNSRFFKFND